MSGNSRSIAVILAVSLRGSYDLTPAVRGAEMSALEPTLLCHERTLASSMFEQEIARSNAGLISSGVRFRIRVLWGAFRYFLYVEIIE